MGPLYGSRYHHSSAHPDEPKLNGIIAPSGSDPPEEADVPWRIRHTPIAHRFPARAYAPACAEGFEENALRCEGGDNFGGKSGLEAGVGPSFYRPATWSFDDINVAEAVMNVVEAGLGLSRGEECGAMT